MDAQEVANAISDGLNVLYEIRSRAAQGTPVELADWAHAVAALRAAYDAIARRAFTTSFQPPPAASEALERIERDLRAGALSPTTLDDVDTILLGAGLPR